MHSPRRHFKTKQFKFWESRNGDKRLGVISLLSLKSQHGERTPLVSDVIIAGWGVEVSLWRLKWKIAPHIFGKGVCCVTCLQKPPPASLSTLFGVWKASWHWDFCFQPKTLWAHSSTSSSALRCWWCRIWFVCFIPQPNICPQR